MAYWHSIPRQIFNPPGIASEVVVNVGFFGGQEVVVPTAAKGQSPVVRLPADRRTDNILIVIFRAAGGRIAHLGAGIVPRGTPGQVRCQMVVHAQ
ncbi:hypothetical protein D3C86_1922150 [compost metagenome]